MASERDSGYSSPYGDGGSPVTIALAIIVLVVILLAAGWMLIPCERTGRCAPSSQDLDRYAIQSALRTVCSQAGETEGQTQGQGTLDCWCTARRLAPGFPETARPGLSEAGLRTLERLLVDEPGAVTFNDLGTYLDPSDYDLLRRVTTQYEEDGGCRVHTGRRDADRYPDQPWPVRDGCDGAALAGSTGENGDAQPRRRSDYVTIAFDWNRPRDALCLPRESASRLYADGARYWLLRGDAELSRHDVQCLAEADRHDPLEIMACAGGWRGGLTIVDGRYSPTALDTAMRYWHQASDWGRPFGAQASIMAQRRLQAHMVQCLSASDGSSLQRMTSGGPGGQGDAVMLSLRQRALGALGYYAGPIDGQYTSATREATRGFQRELGYDETGTLTPRQTTLLICHAAQTARDAEVQNALGIMYALGLGVEENIDLAVEWLETAARRNDRDAYLNLALIYGTGRVLESYRLCGVSENAEQADAYLREAARLRHPRALQWCNSLGCDTGQISAAERWQRIGELLEQEGWPANENFDAQINRLSLTCLHAETRQGGG